MSLLIWAVIGVLVGFALSALLSRKFNHRIAPAVILLACGVALGVARWAGDQPGEAMLQAQAFIVGCALLGGVAGSIGWLIFARQQWAMLMSAVVTTAYIVTMPLVVPILARAVAGLAFSAYPQFP